MASDLIERLSLASGQPKAVCGRVVASLVQYIHDAASGQRAVSIPGVGTFTSRINPAHKARNPATGEPIDVPARRKPVFRPARALRDAANRDFVAEKGKHLE